MDLFKEILKNIFNRHHNRIVAAARGITILNKLPIIVII
jgi:hypothetical protein